MLKIDYIFFNVLITTRIATPVGERNKNAPQAMRGVFVRNERIIGFAYSAIQTAAAQNASEKA